MNQRQLLNNTIRNDINTLLAKRSLKIFLTIVLHKLGYSVPMLSWLNFLLQTSPRSVTVSHFWFQINVTHLLNITQYRFITRIVNLIKNCQSRMLWCVYHYNDMLERKYITHKQYIYIYVLYPDGIVRKVTLAFYIYCSKNLHKFLHKLFISLYVFIIYFYMNVKSQSEYTPSNTNFYIFVLFDIQ